MTIRKSFPLARCVSFRQILVMHLRPLHPLLRFPKGVGLQTVSVPIADAVRAIGFRSDREPRRCRDGVAHGRVRQLLIGLLPRPTSKRACETTRCSPLRAMVRGAGMMETVSPAGMYTDWTAVLLLLLTAAPLAAVVGTAAFFIWRSKRSGVR